MDRGKGCAQTLLEMVRLFVPTVSKNRRYSVPRSLRRIDAAGGWNLYSGEATEIERHGSGLVSSGTDRESRGQV